MRVSGKCRVCKAFAGDAFDGAFVEVDGDFVPLAVVNELGQVDLTHHGRHDVTILQMEVIVGAIEVRGHHGNIVRPILQVVALAHLQACYLRNSVLLVGILQRRGQQAVLLHGLWSVLGIDTSTTQEKQFLYPMGIGLTDDVALDLHVHHDEVSAIERVGHDAAHKGSSQDHCIWLFFIEELPDSHLVCQVQFLMTSAHEVGIASLKQVIPYSRAHKSIVACYVYFTILI